MVSSEELAARVEAKLGVQLAAGLDSAGLTVKARGLRLSEAIENSVRRNGPSTLMSELIHDFVVDRFLFKAAPGSEARQRAPFTKALPPGLGEDMDEEFELAISIWLVDENATLERLLTGETAFVNAALAEHYGIPLRPVRGFEAVRLQTDTQMGLASRGAFLARYPRPPDRGLQLAEALRCTKIPPLPLATPSPWDDPNRKPAKELIQSSYGDEQATCAACHQAYVGYGIALDGYDELGRYAPVRNGYTVDTSYSMSLDPENSVDFSGPLELGRALSASSTVRECLVERFVERLGLNALSEAELRCVLTAFGQRNASFSSLLALLAPRLIDAE